MAIKYHKKMKDRKNRAFFLQNEKIKKYYKFMYLKYVRLVKCNNGVLRQRCIFFLKKFQKSLQQMPKVKINNYCVLTGRDKGVYRDFKLSRHQIKSNFKFITGLRNSSF